MSRRRRAARKAPTPERLALEVRVSVPTPIDPELLHELAEAVQAHVVEHPTPEPPERDLESLSVATLRVLAGQRGVVLGKARTKAAIIEALRT